MNIIMNNVEKVNYFSNFDRQNAPIRQNMESRSQQASYLNVHKNGIYNTHLTTNCIVSGKMLA